MADLSIPRAAGAPDKIPLVDRKNIRDGFEAKKEELEKGFSEILGEPWTIHVDTTGVYSYINAKDSSYNGSAGSIIYEYFDGALSRLKYFASVRADDVPVIGQNAPKHIITLEPTSNEDVTYCSTDFKDGRWRLLFRDNNVCSNVRDTIDKLDQVLNEHSKSQGASLSLTAKRGIRDDYEAGVKDVLAQARKYLNEDKITFEPNFEANYAALTAFAAGPDGSSLRKGWDSSVGSATLGYFKGFVDQLEYLKFANDDMMQEAFNEVVDSHVISFVVVDKISRSYNDAVIDSGKLLIRTKASEWWTNVGDACNEIDKLL